MKPTEEQEAFLSSTAKLLIGMAGPGSGKTTTLVELVNRMSHEDRADTVLITFTNAVGASIRGKLEDKTVRYAGNTHGYMLRLLRKYGTQIGLPANIAVINDTDADELFVEVRDFLKYKGSIEDAEWEVKNNPMVPKDGKPPEPTKGKDAFDLAKAYHHRLTKAGLIDFDGLLSYGLHLLKSIEVPRPAVLIVDEIQDSSPIQWAIYRAIRARRVVMVGDVDQSIYGFLNAKPDEILKLAKGGKADVKLITKNHRSGKNICDAATRLIGHNPPESRWDKATVSASNGDSNINMFRVKDDIAERDFIIKWAKQMEGRSAAILCRYNAGVKWVRESLTAAGVKLQATAAKPQGLDLLIAAMSAFENPSNNEVVLQYVKRKLGASAAAKIKSQCLEKMMPVAAAVVDLFPDDYFTVNHGSITVNVPAGDQVAEFLSWMTLNVPNEGLTNYVAETAETIGDDATLLDLVIACSDESDEPQDDGIKVTTIHRAKGLEWDHVLLPVWSEGIFPNRMSDEERRIAFVGVTRARLSVDITSPSWIKKYPSSPQQSAEPSRFIKELGL